MDFYIYYKPLYSSYGIWGSEKSVLALILFTNSEQKFVLDLNYDYFIRKLFNDLKNITIFILFKNLLIKYLINILSI